MGDQEGGVYRPWRARALLVSVVLVLVVSAAAFATLGMAPLRAGASTGPTPSAVGPSHEMTLGTIALTIQTTNPLQATLLDEFYMWISVYSFMINTDASLNFEGDIALRRQQTNLNPNTYDFWLAKNAFFIDPRTCSLDAQQHRVGCATDHPVTGDDVIFSFNYLKANEGSLALLASSVEFFLSASLVDNDPYHVRIVYDGPYAPTLNAIASVPILPKYIWSPGGVDLAPDHPNALPIGSGPYMVRPDPADPRKMLTPPPLIIDRNPRWHGKETVGRQVFPDTIKWVSYTTTGAMSIDLSLGVLDVAIGPSSDDYLGFLATATGVWRQQVPGGDIREQNVNVFTDDLRRQFAATSTRPVQFGSTNPLLADSDNVRGDADIIREAIHMATSQQDMIDRGHGGLATKTDVLIPPYNKARYDYPDFVAPYDNPVDGDPATINEEFPQDTAMARQLLHDYGWLYDCAGNLDTGTALPLCRLDAGGQPTDRLEFTFLTQNTDIAWEADSRTTVENAREAGILFNLDLISPAEIGRAWYRLNYEVWLWDWIFGALADPSLIMVVQSCGGMDTLDNDNGFCPLGADGTWLFDEVLNASYVQTDVVERRKITDFMQRWIYEFASYNMPIVNDELYAGSELRWTNWGDWRTLLGLPLVSGNTPLLGQYPYPIDQKPPQFSLATFEGVEDLPVQFSVAAIDPEGGPLRYRWDFDTSSEPVGGTGLNADGIYGNDEQATSANPTHTYATQGTFGVALRVSEDGGDFFTVQRTTAKVSEPGVGNPKISAVTFGPSDPTVAESVDFAGAASDPAGSALTYSWNFGDGSPVTPFSSSPLASHAYSAAATPTVTLTVRNALGGQSTSQTIVQVVNNVAPTVAPLESKAVIVNTAETFVAFASDANARDVLSYSWTFGDGSPAVTGNPVTHTYATQVGSPFTLTVQVSDGEGHTTTQSASISVVGDRNRAPSIRSLTASPSTASTTQEVTFVGTVSDLDGNALTWAWDFNNDGTVDKTYATGLTAPNTVVTRTEVHQYTTPSTGAGYRSRLTITDQPPAGATPRTVTTTVTVRVLANAAPTLSTLAADKAIGIAGEDFRFSSTSSDTDGDALSWVFDFGDGATMTGVTPIFGGPISADHAYSEPGDYLAILSVNDGNGGEAATAALASVSGPALLRVTTNPALPGKIIVDGVARDEWGLTWMKIAPGSHTVTFSDIVGVSPPSAIPVTTVAGETTVAQGNYQVSGFLRVFTNPAVPGTIIVNGAPSNDWGMWREAAPGMYTVSFGPVAGFDPPAPVTVQVNAGATTTVEAVYTPNPNAPGPSNMGELRVTTNPAVAATILIDGVPRDDWGLTWLDLPAGTYTVSFSGVYGVTAPPPTQVVVNAGQTTVYDAQFIVHGQLRVLTNPAVPATIFVAGHPRNDWGMWQSMEPGTYKVSFGPVPGMITPAAQTAVVTAGGFVQIEGVYAPAPAQASSVDASGIAALEAFLADLKDGKIDSVHLASSDPGFELLSASATGTATRMHKARSH